MAVMQLDELTQQNAALVEEASAASQAMAEQARDLSSSMARYQVNAKGDSVAVESAAPAAPVATPAERRKAAARPWAESRTKAAQKPEPRASARVANGADDTEWKEF